MGVGIALDERDCGGAARSGLEAENAGTGEQVEAIEAVKRLPQPVEEGFPHAIWRWT